MGPRAGHPPTAQTTRHGSNPARRAAAWGDRRAGTGALFLKGNGWDKSRRGKLGPAWHGSRFKISPSVWASGYWENNSGAGKAAGCALSSRSPPRPQPAGTSLPKYSRRQHMVGRGCSCTRGLGQAPLPWPHPSPRSIPSPSYLSSILPQPHPTPAASFLGTIPPHCHPPQPHRTLALSQPHPTAAPSYPRPTPAPSQPNPT